ncbi:MAG TPA: MBOAT family O-acyltransferase [Candidatus Binatia bacterium]|nr:MBOAT family O-acyltransferase [Candidatus Binatia bacterium]
MEAIQSDFLLRRGVAFNMLLGQVLGRCGVPDAVVNWLSTVLPLVELAGVLATVALAVRALHRASQGDGRSPAARMIVEALHAAAALAAVALLGWLLRHPSPELLALLVRWDYLVFCLLAGCVLRRAPLAVRTWVLAGLGLVLVPQYVGSIPFGVTLLGGLAGFAAARCRPTSRPGVRVAVQGLVLLTVLAVFWRLRLHHGQVALEGWGLFSFVLFRHISFVVEAARGAPATLGNYLCYVLFHPSCLGAVEVYPEFLERNLRNGGNYAYRLGVAKVVKGSLLMWLGLQISTTETTMFASSGTWEVWRSLVLVFLRGALFATGVWSGVEGGALFLGFRLHPNFSGIFTAQSPSQFWHAWRGTMTNWLVRYVYIPLGGNRRRRVLNILAAFAASVVWHCMGIPFLHPSDWTPFWLLPIVCWGLLNFLGVALHSTVRRRWPAGTYSAPVNVLVRVAKGAGTLTLGLFTPGLLAFSLGNIDRFPWFVRTLLGLG